MFNAVRMHALQILGEMGDALLSVTVQHLSGPVQVWDQPRHLVALFVHVDVVGCVFRQTDDKRQDDKLIVAVPRTQQQQASCKTTTRIEEGIGVMRCICVTFPEFEMSEKGSINSREIDSGLSRDVHRGFHTHETSLESSLFVRFQIEM
jgi:hypothetical protein